MGKNIENFRDELTKLAKAVEIIEDSFLSNGQTEVKVLLDDDTFFSLMRNLNNRTQDNKCIVSIGNVDFTFLKK
jgi:hypothetical protein